MRTRNNTPAAAALSSLTALTLLAALAAGGCASVGQVTGQTEATTAAMQSETAATTAFHGGTNRVVVTFNDETGNEGKVLYGPTTRKILKGASLMGWSYSEDKGKTWTYGGKLSPPTGWSALWGDPAATTSGKSYAVVFISNLAMPDAKFPGGGIDGYVTYGSKGAHIGGACIARSTDGGKSFAHYQCVSNTEPVVDDGDAVKGHFYDGGSMASTPGGEIFAAYIDISSSAVRVWRAADHNAPFKLIGDPFPGLIPATHPRLRASRDGWLYAAVTVATSGGYHVFVNRYRDGKWGKPVPASETTVSYPEVSLGTTVQGSALTIRTGPQFSFDIGAASEGGKDALRFLYTRKTAYGRLYIEGSACAADLSGCWAVTGWKAGPSSAEGVPLDVFNPNVAAWGGFIGLPPHWTSSFYERYGGSVTQVALSRMNLAYVNGTALGIPVNLVKNIVVCSDTRGYWGDYDDMLHVGFDGTTPVFVRFASSDHGKGCSQRWTYVAHHQHVQSIRDPE